MFLESCPSWSKEHDWKSCNRQKRFVGSNPMLSAKKSPEFVDISTDSGFFFLSRKMGGEGGEDSKSFKKFQKTVVKVS